MTAGRGPSGGADPGAGGGDQRLAAFREVIRLAEDDRRRGVRYWFDADLAASLRDTARELSGGAPALRAGSDGTTPVAHARRPASGPASPVPRTPVPMAPPVLSPAPASPPVPPPAPAPAPEPVAPPAPGPAPAPPVPAVAPEAEASPDPAARPRAARPAWPPPPEATGREAGWRERLDALGAEAAGCTACRLCETRNSVVFASGGGTVPLVFVGEAPGHDEDLQGEAFVGRAGQLLTKIIEAIGLSREQVYICNVLKCRPPANRNPMPDEIAACRHFLEDQLEILRPRVICTLGLFAAQLLLGSQLPIGKLRGRLFTDGRWPILPTFHPAYLLRNPSAKATVWEDVQQVRRLLDS